MPRLNKLKVRLPQEVLDRINVLAKNNPKNIKLLCEEVKNTLEQLDKTDINIRTEATGKLAKLDPKIAVLCFKLVLGPESPFWGGARATAAEKYLEIARKTPDVYGHRAVEDVGEFLQKEENPYTVANVALALSELCKKIEDPSLKNSLNSKIKKYLEELALHKDPVVRSSAWRGLENVERLINSKT